MNPWLANKLKKLGNPEPVNITVLVEVEPNFADEVKQSLIESGFTIKSQAFNFLTVPNVPADKVSLISKIKHVKTVNYDTPVGAVSFPFPLPFELPLFGPVSRDDPLVGTLSISEIVAPKKLRAPDLLFPFSPLRILSTQDYKFIPSSEVNKEVIDVETDLDGSGVKVAVLDTGSMNPLHPMNMFRIKPLSTSIEILPNDGVGHGSWCLSAVGGLPWPTIYGNSVGMAPKADLYSIKVLGSAGMGTTSEVLKGMELAAELGMKIVSMSLGSEPQGGCKDDPTCKAVKTLADKGIIVVVAAGNSGPGAGTVGSPGMSPEAITVGSWSLMDDAPSYFSSRGPTPDGVVKPDVMGYGGGRKSDDLTPDELIVNGCEGWLDGIYDGILEGFGGLHGTSMSTPQIAGLLALVEQDRNRDGATLTLAEVQELIAKGRSKDNESGYGLAKLSWFVS